jgi:uracil-DNA glycosylase
MSDEKNLGEEILGHLELYEDLGVRWTRSTVKDGSSMSVKQLKPSVPAAKVQVGSVVTTVKNKTPGIATINSEVLDAIRADLKDCRKCKLASSRKNIVFGSGNPHAELMFVGEAPGADEDAQGLPFVGRAGQLLTKIIESIRISRDEVFICNILKCRPPGNRNPEIDEIAACEQYLFHQISAVKPKIICALGAFGAQTLLRTTETIGRLRGRLIDFRGVKLIATFHPAYLLRNPNEKRKVWEDMRVIRNYLRSIQEPGAGNRKSE